MIALAWIAAGLWLAACLWSVIVCTCEAQDAARAIRRAMRDRRKRKRGT